jgi:hypothetical protein
MSKNFTCKFHSSNGRKHEVFVYFHVGGHHFDQSNSLLDSACCGRHKETSSEVPDAVARDRGRDIPHRDYYHLHLVKRVSLHRSHHHNR